MRKEEVVRQLEIRCVGLVELKGEAAEDGRGHQEELGVG